MKRQPDYEIVRKSHGGFMKLAGICTAAATAIGIGFCAIFVKPAWWKAVKDFVRRLFSR